MDAGLALYGTGHGTDNVTLFGGHDAKVCGLSHRGLSLWFTGRAASAIRSLSEARRWAQQTGHVGSIAHAYINEAMLHCYRRDFSALRTVIADIRHLTGGHHLPSLAATAQIFEGWCEGNAGHVERGRDMIRQGLCHPRRIADAGGLSRLLRHARRASGADRRDRRSAGAFVLGRRREAEQSGHRYWLAELHHRRARLLFRQGAPGERYCQLRWTEALRLPSEQNAVPILAQRL